MRYLITGGAGFIGSHLADALLAASHEVIVIDDLSTGDEANLQSDVTLLRGDCADRRLLSDVIDQIDGIFHLAAIASVQASIADWANASKTNQWATVTLLEAIAKRKAGVIPFVYASSAAVYGDPDASYLPLKETTPTVPLTPYGADKLGSEQHARIARDLFNIPTLGLRFFNVYGPRQDPSSPYSGVISIFMDRIKAGQGITIFGDGQQSRDFIFVGDVVARLCQSMALLHQQTPEPHALNVCLGESTTIHALAQIIGKVCGKEPDITFEDARSGDIRTSLGDPSALQTLLGAQQVTALEDGLKTLL